MKYIDQIKPKNPIDFEQIIKKYLHDILGFTNLEDTPIKGDFGADLFGEKENYSYAIQIKYYSSPVNLKAVQEAYSAKTHFRKDKSMVITNSTFTESAINLAKSTGCILIDGTDLNTMYAKKFKSFNEQIKYLEQNKLRSFKITNDQLIKAYFDLKETLKKQPTISNIDKQGKFSSSTFRKRWGTWNSFLKSINEPIIQNKTITIKEFENNFKKVKDLIEKIPTTKDMNVLGQFSISAYAREFGTWNNFLKTQNIEVNKKHKIPKEDFIKEFKRVKSILKKVPTKTEFDKVSKISSNSFKRIWGGWNNFLKDIGEKMNHREDITSDELIAEYKRLKEYLDKKSLTQSDMNKKGKFSSSTYERRFGSWNKFLKHIGDLPNINTCISKKDLLDDYHRISEKIGKSDLSAKDIREHSKYSLSSFLKKFSSWNKCKKEATEN